MPHIVRDGAITSGRLRRSRVRRRAPERGKPPPADTLQQMPRHGARPASIWPPRVAVLQRAPERRHGGELPPVDAPRPTLRHGAGPASIWSPRVAVLQRAPERRHGGGPPPVDALQLILRYGAGPASSWSPRFAVLQRASERRHGLLQTSSKSKYLWVFALADPIFRHICHYGHDM